MLSSNARIVAVADVSVGYGSPQIPRLTQSLAEHYGCGATILEPDEAGKKRLDTPPKDCTIERVATSVHPHTGRGRREFVWSAARRVNELRPDMLVLFCTYTLPVLSQLRYRPHWTVYHSIEMVAAYGKRDVAVNRCFADDIDLVLFPEENRARIDVQRCGLTGLPLAVVYNVSNERIFQPVAAADRLPRFLYSGTIDRDQTFAEYFLRPDLQAPIDLFGRAAGRDADALQAELEKKRPGKLWQKVPDTFYHGYVPAAKLKEIRRQYAYSIILWAPTSENQFYAAPNKFFDAIADGIPPIVAPHPQCKMVVDRYGCGVLMEDWSFEAFRSAVEHARAIFGTPEYDRLVAGCGRAVECELNWPAQLQKVKRLLPASLAAA